VVLLAGSKGQGWETLLELGVGEVLTLTEEGEDPQPAMVDAERMLTRAAVVACRRQSWT
jgi:hypothetical protein